MHRMTINFIDLSVENMHTLYDSESFVVVHLRSLPVAEAHTVRDAAEAAHLPLFRHGFEIVDKRSGHHVYLDGHWAELFQQQITQWQDNTPTQEEVEDALENYAGLAVTPVRLH